MRARARFCASGSSEAVMRSRVLVRRRRRRCCVRGAADSSAPNASASRSQRAPDARQACVMRAASARRVGAARRRDAGAGDRAPARARARRSATRVRSWTSPASWPQAAAMSSPRVLRIVVTMPPSCSTGAKAAIRSGGERFRPDAANGLNGNQVDLARHARPARAVAAQQRQQGLGLRRRVVDAIEHAVLEGDEVARRALEVAARCAEQLGDRVLAVERHQLVAQGVVGRMQRDRESDRAIFAQAIDHRHDARGRDRHAAARQAVAVVVEHRPERRHERAVVLQRLAHAHHDDVGDGALARRKTEAAAQREFGMPELGDDLGGRQVAAEALVAGRAEAAVDGAAGLRRDAQRAALRLGDEDGLDGVAVADVEQPLDRAVERDLLADDGRPVISAPAISLSRNGLARSDIAAKSRSPR